MRFLCLLALLPVTFAIVVDDGCGRHDRIDSLNICGNVDTCGRVCGDTRLGAYGKYAKQDQDQICADIYGQGKYDIGDNDYRDDKYCLDAGLCARGRFCGYGNDDRGRCFEQVAKFRRGAGYNNCGKKKQYSDYDTCGKMKRYADKNWHAKVGLTGDLYARGKYDLTGKSDSRIDLSEFGGAGVQGQANTYRNTDTGDGYALQGRAELSGPLRARANIGRMDRYERHENEPERIPDLCGRYCDRCGRYDQPCSCDTCRYY
ncbi:unnamed protein product [Calicophoron daubneyi]|uniref:Uncharacterized protein n=1 Tax=Calicophoron daubneyi TaxID=300641 RepID=A0AAV2SY61_CALDB